MITTINEFKKYLNENNSKDLYYAMNDLNDELKDLKQRRRQLDNDMEEEAGEMGDEWTDTDGNRYGALMNDLDEEIITKQQEYDLAVEKYYEKELQEDENDGVHYYSGLKGDILDNAQYIKDFRKQNPNATLDDEANNYKSKFSLNSSIEEIKLALFDLDEKIANIQTANTNRKSARRRI